MEDAKKYVTRAEFEEFRARTLGVETADMFAICVMAQLCADKDGFDASELINSLHEAEKELRAMNHHAGTISRLRELADRIALLCDPQ